MKKKQKKREGLRNKVDISLQGDEEQLDVDIPHSKESEVTIEEGSSSP